MMGYDEMKLALVEQLEHLGASVFPLQETGVDLLLVGFKGGTWLLQVEHPEMRGMVSHLEAIESFRDGWRGRPILRAKGISEACKAMGISIMARKTRGRLDAKTVSARELRR
jgi:hypothetical protein